MPAIMSKTLIHCIREQDPLKQGLKHAMLRDMKKNAVEFVSKIH